MQSSGNFQSDFTAEMECTACETIAEVDVTFDPELTQPYLFVCPECGNENRPEFEDDPDRWRDL